MTTFEEKANTFLSLNLSTNHFHCVTIISMTTFEEKAKTFLSLNLSTNHFHCVTIISMTTFEEKANTCLPALLSRNIVDTLDCILCSVRTCHFKCAVRTDSGTTNWFSICRGMRQGCIMSPQPFSIYKEHQERNERTEQ